MLRIFLLSTAFFLNANTGVWAQSLNIEAAKAIKEFANSICGVYQLQGEREQKELKGQAEARAAGLIGKLVDLGVEGAVEINTEKYTNVRSDEIGEELKDIRTCRRSVWDDLKASLFEAKG